MARLFDPYTVKGVTLRNRVGVSPMCQYSCTDGFASDWHLVHLGARATGGAGLVCVEATAVEPRGRISPQDMGIWKDEHVEPLARVARFVTSQGAVPAIQLAHAGRKGSTLRPWDGSGRVEVEQGGFQPVAPSALPFDDGWHVPHALTAGEIAEITRSFVLAAKRAQAAGFQWIELHFAHGYLAHEFLSPLSNTRTDAYGGSFDARVRFALETTRAVRAVWPEDRPLAARLSCTDWVEGGGWTLEDSVSLSRKLAAEGVDLVDCSSGGNASREDPGRTGLPGAVRAGDPALGGGRDRGGGAHHRSQAGRRDRVDGQGRHGDAGARYAARSVLGAARRPGARRQDEGGGDGAGAVPARVLKRREEEGSHP